MRCPKCGSIEDKVIDSRPVNHFGAIRRRRICLRCQFRFTTYEEIERIATRLIKRDGRHEPFDRNKLLAGMVAACLKRPVKLEALEQALEVDAAGARRVGDGFRAGQRKHKRGGRADVRPGRARTHRQPATYRNGRRFRS